MSGNSNEKNATRKLSVALGENGRLALERTIWCLQRSSSYEHQHAGKSQPRWALDSDELKRFLEARSSQRPASPPKRRRNVKRRKRAKELRAKVDGLEKRLREVKTGPPPAPPIDPFQLSVGQIGKLTARVEILQVLDETTMLVVPIKTVTRIDFIGVKSQQSFSEKRGEPIMVRGSSTDGFTDRKAVEFSDVFEVTGTESYRAVTGATKTVFTVRRFDLRNGARIRPALT
jgi:hypothetical protein